MAAPDMILGAHVVYVDDFLGHSRELVAILTGHGSLMVIYPSHIEFRSAPYDPTGAPNTWHQMDEPGHDHVIREQEEEAWAPAPSFTPPIRLPLNDSSKPAKPKKKPGSTPKQ